MHLDLTRIAAKFRSAANATVPQERISDATYKGITVRPMYAKKEDLRRFTPGSHISNQDDFTAIIPAQYFFQPPAIWLYLYSFSGKYLYDQERRLSDEIFFAGATLFTVTKQYSDDYGNTVIIAIESL